MIHSPCQSQNTPKGTNDAAASVPPQSRVDSLSACWDTPAFRRAQCRRRWFILALAVVAIIRLFTYPVPKTIFLTVHHAASIAFPAIGAYWCLKRFAEARRTLGALSAPGKGYARGHWSILFFGLACLANSIATLLWCYYEHDLPHQPSHSPADAIYLCFYPLAMAAILTLPTRGLVSRVLRSRILVDSIIGIGSVITFSWYFILGPTMLKAVDSPLAKTMSVAYRFGDLLVWVCLMVVATYLKRTSIGPVVRRLSYGLGAVILGDSLYTYQALKGTYQTGSITDAFWLIGYPLMAYAACSIPWVEPLHRESDQEPLPAQESAWRPVGLRESLTIISPYLPVPAVCGLAVYVHVMHGRSALEPGVWIGAAIMICGVLIRQVLTILENERLREEMEAAHEELRAEHAAVVQQANQLAALNARLESLATTDGMTGLANHRAFQEELRRMIGQAARGGGSFSVIMLDVDRFKTYNDTFGHPAGDEVLRQIATLLRATVREGDLTARYGGEEFVILASQADLEAAAEMAERIRSRVAGHSFPHRNVTVSIGVSSTFEGCLEPEELVSRADRRLYAAKHGGRDRVVSSCEGCLEPGADRPEGTAVISPFKAA